MDGKEFGEGEAKTKLVISRFVTKSERKKIKVPYNNLFVKQFPTPDFSDEDLKVLLLNLKLNFVFRSCSNPSEKSIAPW